MRPGLPPVPAAQPSLLQRGPLAVPVPLLRVGFALGSAPLVLLLVLVGTGIPLALHYEPGLPASAESVGRIASEVPFGWYVRALHHWAAALLAVATVLHLLRVALDRAFRAPRVASWLAGVGLLVLVMLGALTGDVLPGDAHGYWTLRMAQQAFRGIPWFGDALSQWLLGAGLTDDGMLARVRTIHLLVLPALVALGVLAHLGSVRRAGIAEPSGEPSSPAAAKTVPYWRVEVVTACVLLVGLNVLAVTIAPPVGAAAEPLVSPARIEPGWVGAAAAACFDRVPQPAAQLLALGTGALLLGWPWLDGWAKRRRAEWLASPWWLVAGVVGVVALGVGRVLGGR